MIRYNYNIFQLVHLARHNEYKCDCASAQTANVLASGAHLATVSIYCMVSYGSDHIILMLLCVRVSRYECVYYLNASPAQPDRAQHAHT